MLKVGRLTNQMMTAIDGLIVIAKTCVYSGVVFLQLTT